MTQQNKTPEKNAENKKAGNKKTVDGNKKTAVKKQPAANAENKKTAAKKLSPADKSVKHRYVPEAVDYDEVIVSDAEVAEIENGGFKDDKPRKRAGGPMGGPMGGGSMGGGKPKNFKKAIGNLFRYCKKFRTPILIALGLAVISTVISIIAPNILGDLTDAIYAGFPRTEDIPLVATGALPMPGIDLNEILRIGLILISIYAVSTIFNYSQGFIMATVTQKVSKNLRKDISQKINRLPLRYFDSNSYGDVLSRVTNDVDSIGQTLNQSFISIFTSVLLLFGVVIMMFVTQWAMALAAIGATLVGFVFMIFIISKSQKHFIRQQVALGKLNGLIEETYSGHNVVKAFNAEEGFKAKFGKINGALYTSAWKSQFMSGMMMPIMSLVGNLGFVAVCVVGGALMINGTITLGVITSFLIYIRLFMNPLSTLAQAFTNLQSAAASSERVFEFLGEKELEEESGKSAVLANVRGEVDFENVKFGYLEDKVIINDFSAKASPGQKIAIVGPTGAGKTTMVNLLMRFYEVNGGAIKIDGVNTRDITRHNLRDNIGMVLQDTWLFEGTIKENIIYSKQNVADEEVYAAAKAANLDHFIRTLPDGYNTVLNDKTSLSAGQKQLITIARAMVENAPMLILDEATSSVDTRTEILIQQAMDKLMKGRTSFVIAHRLSTIKNADLILVMKDGDIIESGNHNALMKKGGFYSDLYNSQFEYTAA